MDLIANLSLGFAVALTPANLGFCFLGALIGTLVGVLPGIAPITTIAILLPFTFTLEPASSLIGAHRLSGALERRPRRTDRVRGGIVPHDSEAQRDDQQSSSGPVRDGQDAIEHRGQREEGGDQRRGCSCGPCGAEPDRSLRAAGGIRHGLRVHLLGPFRLHDRAEHSPGWRCLPGNALSRSGAANVADLVGGHAGAPPRCGGAHHKLGSLSKRRTDDRTIRLEHAQRSKG